MAAIAVFAAVLWSPPATAFAAGLASHRAHYEIALESTRSGSSVDSVVGDMAVQWDGDCSGWTMDYRMVFDVTYVGGLALQIKMEATTWEARSGERYTFSVRTLFDDKEAERSEGHARRDGDGVRAVFTAPEKKEIELAPETIFPTEHTRKVLEAGRRGDAIVSAKVFDGFSEGGEMLVNAVVGKAKGTSSSGSGRFPGLAGLPSWNVQLAFFAADTAAAEPQSEIGLKMYENGVAERLDMGFADFTIRAELKRLELGTVPSCIE